MNIIDFGSALKKKQNALARAYELVKSLEKQARPNIAIAEHLRIKALEKPFAEVLLEMEAAAEEASKRWSAQSDKING